MPLFAPEPLKIAKSYADAGYFARILQAIEVLVDQDVVRSGRAGTEPWKFYDLGHRQLEFIST
jgi:hypothetical protein